MSTLVIVIIIIAVLYLAGFLGGRGRWGSAGYYDPIGLLGFVLLIILIIWLVQGGL